MDKNQILDVLERAWDYETGFFYKIRTGDLDIEQGNQILLALKALDFSNDQYIEKDLVSLLWFMPLSMEWRKDHFSGIILDKYLEIQNEITNQLERLLCYP